MSVSILELTPPAADRRIRFGDGEFNFADLRLPADGEGPFPAVINIHGGFWRSKYDLEHAGHLCAALAASGIATWNIEYSRTGHAGGGWPGTFLDVALACRALFERAADLNIDPNRIIVMGHSAGGHLALWVAALGKVPADSPAASPPLPIRGAISLCGSIDLVAVCEQWLGDGAVADFLGGKVADVPQAYAHGSPRELLPLGTRQLLMHGIHDDIVPVAMGESYVAAAVALGDPAEFIPLDCGHFEVIDPESAVWPTILASVREMLDF